MTIDFLLQQATIWAIPLLSAITLHEAAHAYAAYRLGDQTAFLLGRVSANPFVHIDPVGTIAVPILLLISQSPWLFGWAKPVPIIGRGLKRYRRDLALIAAAGPFANLIMAFAWAAFAKFTQTTLSGLDIDTTIIVWLWRMSLAGLQLNIVLFVFNLLPVPPLDGGKIVGLILPARLAIAFEQLSTFSLLIFAVLLMSGLLSALITPPVAGLLRVIANLFQL